MSDKSPMWGSPAPGMKWGSPVVNTSQSNSPNQSFHSTMPLNQQDPSSSFTPGLGANGHNRPHMNFTPSIQRQYSTPPNFSPSPRPLSHSSPKNMNMSPGDCFNPRFNQNRQSRGRGMSPHGNSPYRQSFQRSFSREDSMDNPGGSSNIDDYIHPSMLEDPWRDIPATPLKKI